MGVLHFPKPLLEGSSYPEVPLAGAVGSGQVFFWCVYDFGLIKVLFTSFKNDVKLF